MRLKQIIRTIPGVNRVARRIYRRWINPPEPFQGSEAYWRHRYEAGGHSGDGSYNELAAFKAGVLNTFVSEHKITSVIEYGCGDGNQLRLARYPLYLGFDISPKAISICKDTFSGDASKTFKLMDQYAGETADLTLSLDVIFHLCEDDVFHQYMQRLFGSSEHFVIIYSSDTDFTPSGTDAHVRHRRFSTWVARHQPHWLLVDHIPNRYPFTGDTRTGSFSDFYIFTRAEPGTSAEGRDGP